MQHTISRYLFVETMLELQTPQLEGRMEGAFVEISPLDILFLISLLLTNKQTNKASLEYYTVKSNYVTVHVPASHVSPALYQIISATTCWRMKIGTQSGGAFYEIYYLHIVWLHLYKFPKNTCAIPYHTIPHPPTHSLTACVGSSVG